MNEEELLLMRFHATYPGVYLCVKHECRVFNHEPVTEWSFWHGGAGEHIGPAHTGATLLAMVEEWERSGERAAACEVHAAEEASQLRREWLAKKRLRADAAKVADQPYTPALIEPPRHPVQFVEGMEEIDLPDLCQHEYGDPVD